MHVEKRRVDKLHEEREFVARVGAHELQLLLFRQVVPASEERKVRPQRTVVFTTGMCIAAGFVDIQLWDEECVEGGERVDDV